MGALLLLNLSFFLISTDAAENFLSMHRFSVSLLTLAFTNKRFLDVSLKADCDILTRNLFVSLTIKEQDQLSLMFLECKLQLSLIDSQDIFRN